MSALEKMREAFDSCTVMAGVEPDFECVYITKDAANALFDEAEAENAKLRELCVDMFTCISHANEADWFYFERDKHGCGMSCVVNGEGCGLSVLADRMRELGIEVDE